MSDGKSMNRRRFLGKSASAVLGAAALPYYVPASALGADGRAAPSNRIVMGCIGLGGRGSGNMRTFLGTGRVQVVAISDIDAERRKRTLDLLAQRSNNTSCDAYPDFRDLLAREDIEAVSVGSPDHWHGLHSLYAVRTGKDVYCEKPLVHTIPEGRALVEAVRRYNRILQTGSQERSGRAHYACELVRNKRIGEIHTIRTYLPTGPHEIPPQPPEPIPPGFDYDMWLGPAPWGHYYKRRCHGSFRWTLDYSDGELTDRGAHVNDIALWGAQPWLKGNIEISGTADFPKDGPWDTPYNYRLHFRYDSGVNWHLTAEAPRGVRFEGTKGWIFVHIHGAKLEAQPASVIRSVIGPNDIHLHKSPGHHLDFLQSIRTREDPVAPVEEGHRTATFCHIGTMCLRLRRKVVWDQEKERFTDPNASRMVLRPMRSPWHL